MRPRDASADDRLGRDIEGLVAVDPRACGKGAPAGEVLLAGVDVTTLRAGTVLAVADGEILEVDGSRGRYWGRSRWAAVLRDHRHRRTVTVRRRISRALVVVTGREDGCRDNEKR